MDRIPDFQTMKNEIRRKAKEFDIPLFVHADLEDQIIVQTVEFVEWKERVSLAFLLKKLWISHFNQSILGLDLLYQGLVRNRKTKIKNWSEFEEIVRFVESKRTF